MKKNILKFFAVLFALVMLFSFASCGGEDKEKNRSETGTTSGSETGKEEITGTTDNTESKFTTEKNNQEQKIIAGAATNGEDGSAKSGGKDTGKDSGKTENEKQTGSNTSETSKPSGVKQEETASTTEPEEKDNEGEFVIPSREIQLPVVPLP